MTLCSSGTLPAHIILFAEVILIPFPPSGTHRCFFELYALNRVITPGKGSSKKDLEKAMKGHVLDQAEKDQGQSFEPETMAGKESAVADKI